MLNGQQINRQYYLHDYDDVCVHDCAQAVRYYDGGLSLPQGTQFLLHRV